MVQDLLTVLTEVEMYNIYICSPPSEINGKGGDMKRNI